MTIDARPTLAAPDDDPYLWLEDIDGARALAWVEAQNAATLGKFAGARFAADRDALAAILDRPDNVPFVARRRPFLYNFWRDEKNPRGLWRRTTLESYRTATPAWDVLLDVDALAAAEGEDWVWAGATTLPGTHDIAMLRLSRGGSDAVVQREFDLRTRAMAPGGFFVPEGKGGITWLDRDTLLLASTVGDGMTTAAGYPRTVRIWKRGADFAALPVIFETKPDMMVAEVLHVDRDRQPRQVIFGEWPGFFDTIVWLGDPTGAKIRLELPTDVQIDIDGGWIAVARRTPWEVNGTTYPADTLLGTSLDAFLKGSRDFAVLFEPGERRALEQFSWVNGRLLLNVLDELQPKFVLITPSPTGWSRARLPGLPEIGVVNVGRLDQEGAESNGDLMATVQDPLTPASMLLLEPGKAPALLKQAPRTFSADNLVVTRHEAISVDGERIPYTQVGPPGETGEAPVHLTGYGGFGVSSMPYYSAAIGKLWLERGGTHVIANIRGGGEFGSRWHEAGRREGKRLSHDDFAAVASDLVRRGVTRPGRVAAEGGSNGGILITNMLTRYPERFGALFCAIPLIDMRRYSKLLAGASWIAEYGDPDVPDDWAFLQTYSAYHTAEPGKAYPPILIATSRRDDRVHPGHARKMAAKLQAMGYDASFYEPAAGGHGAGKDNKERSAFIALGYSFLREKIGWTVD